MGDVAQILGLGSASAQSKMPQPSGSSGPQPPRAMKMTGIPREVMDLLGGKEDAPLPPAVPAFSAPFKSEHSNNNNNSKTLEEKGPSTVKVGNKRISTKKFARKWVWAPFASSARTDGLMLRHWVRAEVEYPDYPYARFDIHLDPVTYTDEEYRLYLQHDSWTKSETDQLMELVRRFELRWAVIYDRWFDVYCMERESPAAKRKVEDLQHRYYSVASILTQSRITQEATNETQALVSSVPNPSEDQRVAAEKVLMDTAAARALASHEPQHQPLIHNLGTGTSNKVFDLNYERERRAHMDLLWNRTKEEEIEETELRKELRLIDAQLRKLKKSGGHILAANAPATAASPTVIPSNTAASSRAPPSRSVSPVAPASEQPAPAALLDQSFASTAPTPMPENPYLQSGRLAPPATGGGLGLNKTTLTRMDAVLAEMKIPQRPLPTKRVCDLYDTVRKDILTLLTLQKMVVQKEGQVQSKRLKLGKMGGNIKFIDEETMMGVSEPTSSSTSPATASTAAAASTTSRAKAPRPKSTKAKATVAKTKVDESAAKVEVKETPVGGGGGKVAKKPAKRKRKAESKSPTNVAAAASVAAVASTPAATTPTAAAATATVPVATTAATATTTTSAATTAATAAATAVAAATGVQPVGRTSPVPQTTVQANEAKGGSKKRARKNAQT